MDYNDDKTTTANWDDTFVDSLELYEKHSKCSAKKVACVLVKNNNILSVGLNGTLPNKENCCSRFNKLEDGKWFKKGDNGSWSMCGDNDHSEWSKLNEVHAEMNAIKKATHDGHFNLEGTTAYITYSPCYNCAKMLVLFGIKRIVFKYVYDNWEDVKDFLETNNIEITQYDKSIKSDLIIEVDDNNIIHRITLNKTLYEIRNSYLSTDIISLTDAICNKLNSAEYIGKRISIITYDTYRDDYFIFKGIDKLVDYNNMYTAPTINNNPTLKLKLRQ